MKTCRYVASALVLIATLPPAAARPKNDLPRFVTRVEPKHPETLYNSLSRGFISLGLVISTEGRVTQASVLRVTHPDFVEPTLSALADWKFEPALAKGQPVEGRLIQNIFFDIRANRNSIADYSFGIRMTPKAELPKDLRYDRAGDVLTVVDAVYPYELALSATDGAARVEFWINDDGAVTDSRVISATHPEFGQALEAMVQACLFTPAQKGRRTIRTAASIERRFGLRETNHALHREAVRLLEVLKTEPAAIPGLEALDGRLLPRYQPPPAYPRRLQGKGIAGQAEIEFIVDITGRAQLPRVVTATAEEFGWAAATAVQQWLFNVPRVAGRPTAVRVRVPLDFQPVAVHINPPPR